MNIRNIRHRNMMELQSFNKDPSSMDSSLMNNMIIIIIIIRTIIIIIIQIININIKLLIHVIHLQNLLNQNVDIH